MNCWSPNCKEGFCLVLEAQEGLFRIYRTTVFQNIDLVSSMGEKGPGPHHMRIHKLYEIFCGIIRLLPCGWAMKGLGMTVPCEFSALYKLCVICVCTW